MGAGGEEGGVIDPQVQAVRMGKRTCRYCGREYRAPVGATRVGCPTCAPSLLDAIGESAELELACTCRRLPGVPGPPPEVHEPSCPLYDGIPF